MNVFAGPTDGQRSDRVQGTSIEGASDKALADVCEAVGITIINNNIRALPMQTKAKETIRRLIDSHGAGHAIITLRAIVESDGNERELRSETIWAVSDCILARPDWAGRGLEFIEAFDSIDLRALRRQAKDILPEHRARIVLGVLLWERLQRALGGNVPRRVWKRRPRGIGPPRRLAA